MFSLKRHKELSVHTNLAIAYQELTPAMTNPLYFFHETMSNMSSYELNIQARFNYSK